MPAIKWNNFSDLHLEECHPEDLQNMGWVQAANLLHATPEEIVMVSTEDAEEDLFPEFALWLRMRASGREEYEADEAGNVFDARVLILPAPWSMRVVCMDEDSGEVPCIFIRQKDAARIPEMKPYKAPTSGRATP